MIEGLSGAIGHALKGQRVFLVRLGALGDSVIITPVLRWLKGQGAEVVVCTSERGRHVLHGNPHIDKLEFLPSDSVPSHLLKDYLKHLAELNQASVFANMTGSIEESISPTPSQPLYKLPKNVRHERCNKNFYEYAFTHLGLGWVVPTLSSADLRPDFHLTEQEVATARAFLDENLQPGERLMVVCWRGSSAAKRYPWMEYVLGEALKRHEDLAVIVVGDSEVDLAQLKKQSGNRICSTMNRWDFRTACAAVSMADVILCPDTGMLHVAAAWDVPKIGLIGANTRENITKHFTNDFSLYADSKIAGCSPCHRLIYDVTQQCDIEPVSLTAWCMAFGIKPVVVADQIDRALEVDYAGRYSKEAAYAAA